MVVSALGPPERKIAEVDVTDRFWAHPVWSPDCRHVILPDRSGPNTPHALFLFSIDGGKRQLTFPPPFIDGDSASALSLDGSMLAFVRNQSLMAGSVYMQRLAPDLTPVGDPHEVNKKVDYFCDLSWMPGRQEILAMSPRSIWRMPLSGSDVQAIPGTEGGRQFSMSAAGRLALARPQWDPDIWRLSLSADEPPARFAHSSRAEYVPDISPDGRRVAFQSDRSGSHEIWVSDSNGSNAEQLTFLKAFSEHPRWSPDGAWIAFDSNAGGAFAVRIMSASGGQPSRPVPDTHQQRSPDWSRDGKSIYFASDRSGQFQIWKVSAKGGPPVQVTSNGGFAASESVDGNTLFYATAHSSTPIWKMPAGGGKEELVVKDAFGAHSFRVLEDGIYFVYVSRSDANAGIRFHHFATGESEWISRLNPSFQAGLTVSPDRRWLLYSTWQYSAGDIMLVDKFR